MLRSERLKDNDILDLYRLVASGTELREGLENILRAHTGAIILIGDSPSVMSIVDGGFSINKEYSPAHVYELAKMDGAIILSSDLKRILYANALLVPEYTIQSLETGTRHKTAERVARQTGEAVISISERRSMITVYKGALKYVVRDTATIVTRANQAIQTLEKYRAVFDDAINNLGVMEFDDAVTLDDVAFVVQRAEMCMRIVSEIDRYIIELGNEGRLVSMQLEELVANVEEDISLVIEDYHSQIKDNCSREVLKMMNNLSYDELMDLTNIIKILGYYGGINSLDVYVSPRGYRILSNVARVPDSVVNNLIDSFKNLKNIMKATISELDDVEGIGEVRARMIKEGIRRVQDQLLLDTRKWDSMYTK